MSKNLILISMLFSLSAATSIAMEKINNPEESVTNTQSTQVTIARSIPLTITQITKFLPHLEKLVENAEYDKVLVLSHNNYNFINVPYYNIENFEYYRMRILLVANLGQLKIHGHDIQKRRNYCKDIIDSMDLYLATYKLVDPPVLHINFYAYVDLFEIYVKEHLIGDEIFYENIKKSIYYGKLYIKSLVNYSETENNLYILAAKQKLMNLYDTACVFTNSDIDSASHESYTQRKQILYFELETTTQDIKEACENIQIEDTPKYKAQTIETLNSSAIETENQNIKSLNKIILHQMNVDTRNYFSTILEETKSTQLFDSYEKIIALETAIFNQTLNRKKKSKAKLSPEIIENRKIKNIYSQYYKIFGSEGFKDAIDFLISFVWQGDFKGAFLRAESLKIVLKENEHTLNSKFLSTYAWVKYMSGDHKEIMKFIVEDTNSDSGEDKEPYPQTQSKKSKKKKSAQKQNKSILVPAGSLEAVQENNTPPLEKIEAENTIPSTNKLTKAERKKLHKQRYVNIPDPEPTTPSTETENLKETMDAIPTPDIATLGSAPSFSEIAPVDLASSYGLRGIARKVDYKIESNSWDFNRKELEAYYQAMGCTIRSGKGSHEVVEFKNVSIIKKNGEMIFILADSMGSLPIPRWTDQVPFYLRKQIQTTREKLSLAVMQATLPLFETLSTNPLVFSNKIR